MLTENRYSITFHYTHLNQVERVFDIAAGEFDTEEAAHNAAREALTGHEYANRYLLRKHVADPYNGVVYAEPVSSHDFDRTTKTAEGPEMDAETETNRPHVGNRYVERRTGQTVTVTRVWVTKDGRTAVAYEWRDDKPGLCESACPLSLFNRMFCATPIRRMAVGRS